MIWRALFGNIGDKYAVDNNEAFKQSLAPAAVILWSAKAPGLIQRLIQFFSNSKFFHASLYVSKTYADLIRQRYPELLINTAIPKEAQYNEMIEAHLDGGVRVRPLALDDNIQLTAYIRPLTQVETVNILYRAYSKVGTQYDLAEVIGDTGIPLPNDPQKPVCSDLVTYAWLPIERIIGPKIDVNRTKPSDIADYLEKALQWVRSTYNS